jgi:hypothetical protein
MLNCFSIQRSVGFAIAPNQNTPYDSQQVSDRARLILKIFPLVFHMLVVRSRSDTGLPLRHASGQSTPSPDTDARPTRKSGAFNYQLLLVSYSCSTMVNLVLFWGV